MYCLCTLAVQAQQFPGNIPGAGLQVQANVGITMRDGTSITLDIYRPSAPGQYPTLYAAGPYPHSSDNRAPNTPETGPVEWLVNQGYNYVLASVRGTGGSSGSFGLLSRDEQQDHYEIIEWIAAQGWSNGQIAGIGGGYYGTAQWQMAIQNPPHLSCIAPYNSSSDIYRELAWTGGLASTDFLAWYEQRIRDAHAFPASGEPRYIDLDMRLEQLRHPLPDEFWTQRSPASYFDQIKIPVLVLQNWNTAEGSNTQLLPAVSKLPAGTHTWVGNWPEDLLNRDLLENELLPFYASCFSGQAPQQSALRITLDNEPKTYEFSDWPPASVQFKSLYLKPASAAGFDAGLSPDAELNNAGTAALGSNTAALVSPAVMFKSPPLDRDIELVGPLLLELYASSSAFDTAFNVEVLEESTQLQVPAPGGQLPTFRNPVASPGIAILAASSLHAVSAGKLKASARMLTSAIGADNQPDYAFAGASPITAARYYRYDIALHPVAYRFHAGNRIVLRISQAEDASLRNKPRIDTLGLNRQYASRLLIPLLPDPSLPLTAPFMPFTEATTPANPANVLPESAAESQQQALARDLFDSSSPIILLPTLEDASKEATGSENTLDEAGNAAATGQQPPAIQALQP